jgi:hypothetical protein
MNQAIIWWEEALKLMEAVLAEKPNDIAKGETCGNCGWGDNDMTLNGQPIRVCLFTTSPVNQKKPHCYSNHGHPAVVPAAAGCNAWRPESTIPQPDREPSPQVSDEEWVKELAVVLLPMCNLCEQFRETAIPALILKSLQRRKVEP